MRSFVFKAVPQACRDAERRSLVRSILRNREIAKLHELAPLVSPLISPGFWSSEKSYITAMGYVPEEVVPSLIRE